MTQPSTQPTSARWARFRFSVVGALWSAPPARGELKAALESLSAKTWTHPVSGREVRFAAKTLERWLYRARRERDDPVGALRKAVRKDCGKVSLKPDLLECLANQYHDYPHWTCQLHYDNLQALVKAKEVLGPLRSYSTVRRYMVAQGLVRKARLQPKKHPGEFVAALRRERREIRSYEAEYVGALWHLDFHHGSLRVVTARGQWQRPLALGILDDHSRYCAHLQWYLSETTEDLVHGFSQGIQKCGLPRAAMSDNGSAMLADEFTEGLLRLGILHETTLPFSAYQNGKQENFWAHLEGRLLEMLGKVRELTLDFLNEATQAWVEIEYHRRVHREIGCSPATRFSTAKDVLRASPSSDALRAAFRREVKRRQRQSDGTISLEGGRFEIPSRYRHFRDVVVRYPRWDLSLLDLVDPREGTILARLFPWDRAANADGRRAVLAPRPEEAAHTDASRSPAELPPLLKQILAEYSATGLPPAYLPKNPSPKQAGQGGEA
jgi:transposase InsO family protein